MTTKTTKQPKPTQPKPQSKREQERAQERAIANAVEQVRLARKRERISIVND
jgi:hypothetical protein